MKPQKIVYEYKPEELKPLLAKELNVSEDRVSLEFKIHTDYDMYDKPLGTRVGSIQVTVKGDA